MSQEGNVEIVRRLYEAFERRDNEYPFTVYGEEIEWGLGGEALGDVRPLDFDEVYRGHAGVQDFWRTWLSAWTQVDFEVGEIAALGDDEVVGFITRQQMSARSSGLLMEMPPYAQIWTLRDGKVTRMRYETVEKARALLGSHPP